MPSSQARVSVLALQVSQCGDEVLERGVGRRVSDAALPLRIGEVENRVGNVVLGEFVGVVDDGSGPAGQTDPVVVGGTQCRGDLFDQLVGQRHERVVRRQLAQEARPLGVVDVRRRVVALLLDEQQHLGGVAVADLGVDAGLLFEQIEEWPDEVLSATRVDRHGADVRLGGGAGAGRAGVVGVASARGGNESECEHGDDQSWCRAHWEGSCHGSVRGA